VVVAIALGERPDALAVLGIVLAVVAIVLISRAESADPLEPTKPSGVGMAFLSGVAIGLFFLCLAQTRTEAGLWPLVAGRSTSVPIFGPPS
jgi:drug/metabolite transporter (DMT)-like permease